MKVKEVTKYAYGYEILALIERTRREKPKSKSDRYHSKQYGEALRYGQLAVVAVLCKCGPGQRQGRVTDVKCGPVQWLAFEAWAARLKTNRSYKTSAGFDFVNYYKDQP